MSDQERKGKSKRQHEDEAVASAKETSEEGSDEHAEQDEEDEEEGEEEDEGEDGPEGEADAARAQRVANALGVGAEDPSIAAGDGADEAEEAAPAPVNRVARRAQAAARRKQRKTAGDTSEKSADPDAEDLAPLPRDKNARAKELLKRRREQAQATEARPIQLLPGEMVDDALARSSSAISKWIRENFGIIQWVILGALAAGGGYLFYESRADKNSAAVSDALMAGVNADRGRVMAEDKRSDEEKELDPAKVFKTSDERSDTALAAYKKVLTEHGGTYSATLARLGEAGDYLDKHDYVQALEGFSAVAASPLAGTDPDVKARALEGLGFAKEGKDDLDGALATFKELEGVPGYKELGLYQQGRLWLAKGDKEKAKDFLKQAREKLEQPTTETTGLHYLQEMTDQTLRRIDPSLVPAKAASMGGPKGGAMTGEEIEKLKRKLQEAMKQKGDQH